MAVSPDNSIVYVTGGSCTNLNIDHYATFAYDASTGAEIWYQRFDGQAPGQDGGQSVAVSPDGSRVFVTGFSTDKGGYWRFATLAYDAHIGTPLWLSRYRGAGTYGSVPYSIVVSPDGERVFVTGYSEDDYATVAIDAATGSRLWVARYNGSGDFVDSACCIGVSPDGTKVFVTGTGSEEGRNNDYTTLAYNAASGTEEWIAHYDGTDQKDDEPSALAVSPDGSEVFITGYSDGIGTFEDYATVAYDTATGTESWVSRYTGPGFNQDQGHALSVSPDGHTVFVTGSSFEADSGSDYATVAYDAATGSPRWTHRLNTPGNGADEARAIAVNPDGSTVYVTGYGGPWTYGDYLTVAYEALSGRVEGVRRFNGLGNGFDEPEAMAVSPDGSRVFVTGLADDGSGAGLDYGTMAYGV